jgi:hypothetical protein
MKTKTVFSIVTILMLSLQAFSQQANEINLYYGTSNAELFRKALDGGAGYNVKSFNEFGIRYMHRISDYLFLETGLNYSKSIVEITPEYMGFPVQSYNETMEIVSVPIYVNYTFWKYMFLDGGFIIDAHISDNNFDSQNGIGFGIGIGAKYDFKNIVIYISPNIKTHAILPFSLENHHQRLLESGIQMGIGFRF